MNGQVFELIGKKELLTQVAFRELPREGRVVPCFLFWVARKMSTQKQFFHQQDTQSAPVIGSLSSRGSSPWFEGDHGMAYDVVGTTPRTGRSRCLNSQIEALSA